MRTGTPHLTQEQIHSRIVNMLTMASSFDVIARFGAVEIIKMVSEYLPLSAELPLCEEQLEALDIFWRRMGDADDVTAYDIQMVQVLELSPQWRAARDWASESLALFVEPGPLAA
ncbi:MAG: hypothetical protein N4A70_08350 [Pelagimonas sp.]|jgi:hypothetical protein|nr:hypothetical protein [Pelagimonas sp.]